MTHAPRPGETREGFNKRLVIEAFDALFNRRDLEAAATYWPEDYIQHASHLAPGREGLFSIVRAAPKPIGHEAGLVMAEGDSSWSTAGSATMGGRRLTALSLAG